MPPRDAAGMAVPFCDLAAVNRELRPQLDAAYARVMDSGEFILDDEVRAFENEWASYCERRHAVSVGNGLDALTLMLRAAGVVRGDEVIVPAHTYTATWMAVSAIGAMPVPVDANGSFLIDVEQVKAAITSQTTAILVVHLYGRPCDMAALRRIADAAKVRLLVDAAQAHGLCGNLLGDAAAFSFYPTKNLGALGDGGAVVTDSQEIAGKVEALRNYGSITKNRHEIVGVNSRLDELQAAFLRAKLPFLGRFNARRAANAEEYGLRTDGVHHQAVATVSRRDVFRQKMAERGIETMVHYPTPPHLQPAYRHLQLSAGTFPVAERLANEIVSLPIGPELTREQVAQVAREWGRS